jgi:hypothetical protein
LLRVTKQNDIFRGLSRASTFGERHLPPRQRALRRSFRR